MSELSPDAQALVERARLEDGPRAEDKQRVRERLAAQLGAAAFASVVIGSAAVSAPTGKAALLKSGLLKTSALRWLAGTMAAGSVAVGGYLLTAPPQATAPAEHATGAATAGTSPLERPSGAGAATADGSGSAPPGSASAGGEPASGTIADSSNASGANASGAGAAGPNAAGANAAGANDVATRAAGKPTKVATSAERRHARKRAPAPAFAPVGDSGSMSAEIALLSRAQQALRARDGKEALRFVRQHAENFPHGALYEERVGIEAIAHCVLGERDHPAVRAFLARAPRSPLSARVKKECGVP